MPYMTGIPDALEKYGLPFEFVTGWSTRGSSSFNPRGFVGHHTAGAKTGDRPSLKLCVEGRSDLAGPLCNVFLPRGLTPAQQKIVIVAAGRANHAGSGGYSGLVGNSSVWGCEAEDDGDGTWTEWQLAVYPRLVAALLDYSGTDERLYCSHRTWAPSRKIDPTGISDSWMKTRVRAAMENPRPVPPPAPPAPKPPEEDPMIYIAHVPGDDPRIFLLMGHGKRHLSSTAVGAELIAKGIAKDVGDVSSATLNEFPDLDQVDALVNRLPGLQAAVDALRAGEADDATAAQVEEVRTLIEGLKAPVPTTPEVTP